MKEQRENLVVLFCDAHSFSIVAGEVKEREGEFMQAFYAQAGEAIVSHGGRIIKYIGDAILATFPEGKEIDAIQAGKKMRENYAAVIEQFGIQTETDLEVGINSGEVITGVFGHESLRSYDVFGETVNRAAMIMHHRGVAVLEPVYEACKDTFSFVQLPDKQVKWSPEPLKAWELA